VTTRRPAPTDHAARFARAVALALLSLPPKDEPAPAPPPLRVEEPQPAGREPVLEKSF
jgi:hypothetical protein